MNRTGSKVMIVLVFTENNKNKGPFSSKKVIFSTKIVLALGIRSNKKVPRQPSKIWTLSTRKNRFALWATSAATGRFHQSYPLPLTNPPCMRVLYDVLANNLRAGWPTAALHSISINPRLPLTSSLSFFSHTARFHCRHNVPNVNVQRPLSP